MATGTKEMERQVEIPSGTRMLSGILYVPPSAEGIVVFAHGSGSGRFSPRNQLVARVLQEAGLGTLLLDLLEEEEAEDQRVFDIQLLAERLQSTADWLRREPETSALRLGYFGASTGTGAALVAAAREPAAVGAVVSRGGRPDLATAFLPAVQAPTLLIVGGDDDVVVELNEQALRLLRCHKELVIIPGATHLFPERGALEEVTRFAKEWFARYLTPSSGRRSEEEFGSRVPWGDMDTQC
jgi:putative phosphoribosyl transferase